MSPNYGTKPDQDAENASMLTDDYPTTNYVIAAPLEAPLRILKCAKQDFFERKYFCKAFAALRTEIFVEDPFRTLHDSVDTSLLDASEQEELFADLSCDMDRLVENIDPIRMGNIAKSFLFIEHRCLWCYRTDVHLDLDRDIPQLIYCGACKATYCSDDHKKKAETAHQALPVNDGRTECDIIRMELKCSREKEDELLLWIFTPPERFLYLPDWSPFIRETYKSTPSLLRTILSAHLTIPLTIIEALRRFSLSSTSMGDKLVIHILGAEEDLKNEGVELEEIVHQLSFLRELAVEHIGPGVGDHRVAKSRAICVACSASGKRVSYTKTKASYHDYVSSGLYTRPTLVVAFDSRLHQLATKWTPTVQLLLAKKTPCIFTSCSKEEAKLDVEHLESMGAKMIWKEEWNKWTGLRVENYFEGDPCRFENAFWLGFQGTASD